MRAALVIGAVVWLQVRAAHSDEPTPTADPALERWNAEIVSEIRRKKPRHVVISSRAVAKLKGQPMRLLKLVRVVPAVRDDKPSGFAVFAIRKGSIPAALGLRNGDTIDQVNGMPVRSIEEGMVAYRAIAAARRLDVRVRRGDATVTLRIDIRK